jgi:hypothetical protein
MPQHGTDITSVLVTLYNYMLSNVIMQHGISVGAGGAPIQMTSLGRGRKVKRWNRTECYISQSDSDVSKTLIINSEFTTQFSETIRIYVGHLWFQ